MKTQPAKQSTYRAVTIKTETRDKLKAIATDDGRTLNNLVNRILEQWLRDRK